MGQLPWARRAIAAPVSSSHGLSRAGRIIPVLQGRKPGFRAQLFLASLPQCLRPPVKHGSTPFPGWVLTSPGGPLRGNSLPRGALSSLSPSPGPVLASRAAVVPSLSFLPQRLSRHVYDPSFSPFSRPVTPEPTATSAKGWFPPPCHLESISPVLLSVWAVLEDTMAEHSAQKTSLLGGSPDSWIWGRSLLISGSYFHLQKLLFKSGCVWKFNFYNR